MKNVSKLFMLILFMSTIFFTSCQQEELVEPLIENQTGDPEDDEDPIPPIPPSND